MCCCAMPRRALLSPGLLLFARPPSRCCCCERCGCGGQQPSTRRRAAMARRAIQSLGCRPDPAAWRGRRSRQSARGASPCTRGAKRPPGLMGGAPGAPAPCAPANRGPLNARCAGWWANTGRHARLWCYERLCRRPVAPSDSRLRTSEQKSARAHLLLCALPVLHTLLLRSSLLCWRVKKSAAGLSEGNERLLRARARCCKARLGPGRRLLGSSDTARARSRKQRWSSLRPFFLRCARGRETIAASLRATAARGSTHAARRVGDERSKVARFAALKAAAPLSTCHTHSQSPQSLKRTRSKTPARTPYQTAARSLCIDNTTRAAARASKQASMAMFGGGGDQFAGAGFLPRCCSSGAARGRREGARERERWSALENKHALPLAPLHDSTRSRSQVDQAAGYGTGNAQAKVRRSWAWGEGRRESARGWLSFF